MALVEFSVIPLGTGTPSVSQYVAKAIDVLQNEQGIKYSVTPMGTIMEGDLPRLLAIIPKTHKAVFDAGVSRVITTVKIDDRRDKPSTMEGKMDSLENRLTKK